MRAFSALAGAMGKGFLRDKGSLFFTLLFPLFFIIIFGTVFGGGDTRSKSEIATVGQVQMVEQLPAGAKKTIDETVEFKKGLSKDDALAQLRKGDLDGVLVQQGDRLTLTTSNGDAVSAGQVSGVLRSVVDGTNVAMSGKPPKYQLSTTAVEDESLKPIQFISPGMIAYGIAVGATFGAAMNLVEWRRRKVLRRLRLAPVGAGSVVTSRVVVSMVIALVQLAIFIGVSMALGLQLNGAWYMAIPLTLCGTLGFLAIGLFCGAVAKTSEAASGLANLITLPMAFLSGAFIPLDEAPAWLSAIANVLPLGWLVEGLKDVMVRGEGPGAALLPMLLILAFAGVVTFISTKFFAWDD